MSRSVLQRVIYLCISAVLHMPANVSHTAQLNYVLQVYREGLELCVGSMCMFVDYTLQFVTVQLA